MSVENFQKLTMLIGSVYGKKILKAAKRLIFVEFNSINRLMGLHVFCTNNFILLRTLCFSTV